MFNPKFADHGAARVVLQRVPPRGVSTPHFAGGGGLPAPPVRVPGIEDGAEDHDKHPGLDKALQLAQVELDTFRTLTKAR